LRVVEFGRYADGVAKALPREQEFRQQQAFEGLRLP
jgi:hypothetical protein